MTRCEDCRFYDREDEWGGTCLIELPPWLFGARASEKNRYVGPNERCDLGQPREEVEP